MPSVDTLQDLRDDTGDESVPLHTAKDWGESHVPELDKPGCDFLATSDLPVAQPHPSSSTLTIQSPYFQDFEYEHATGSTAWVPEEDEEIPAERVYISEQGTCRSASFQDAKDSMCEVPSSFTITISTHQGLREGDQDFFKERVPIDDEGKHGICMSATIDTARVQDFGSECAASKVSMVKSDAHWIPAPSRADESGMGSAGVLGSAWMWILQKARRPQIDDSSKYGFPTCMSAAAVIVGSSIACGLQYAVLPNDNPLQHKDRRGWWYCPFNCTLIWMPIAIAYFGVLLDQFVLAGTGVQLTYLDLFFLWAVGSITMDFLLAVLPAASGRYPFPMAAVITAPVAFMAVLIVCGLCIYPRLRRAAPKHEARKIAVKALFAFVFFEWSICLLLILLFLLAVIDKIGDASLKVLAVLSVGLFREACIAATAKIAASVDPDAVIIGQNLATAIFGVCFAMLVGNDSNALLMAVVISQDIFRGIIVGIMIGNVFVGQFNLSGFLLHLLPAVRFKRCSSREELTEKEVEREKSTLRSSLIASETGEVILPIAFLCSWLIVRIGPYCSSFTGIGSEEYGLDTPKVISVSVIYTVLLVVLEALSVMLLKISLRYFVRVDISFSETYRHFGKLLTVQNIWVVHTSFCARMISCGFDYSLQWKPP